MFIAESARNTPTRVKPSMRNPAYKLLFAIVLSACVGLNADAAMPSLPIPKTPAAPAGAKLPPSALPLRFVPHEHIALVGNSLVERMNLFGNFEALLHSRFPQLELVVRNFARPCDAVDDLQRPSNYTALDDPLTLFDPDTFLCFFGFNEAFAGPAGEQHFREAYGKYLDEMAQHYPRAAAPRLGLC